MVEHTTSFILYADIVGYTDMLRNDQTKALKALGDFNRIAREQSQAHQGRLLQSSRDYIMLSFESAGDALACAEAMQTAFGQLPQLNVRIGLHAGEVIHDEDKLFGEGIHQVTQIEKVAIANSIVVSALVVEDLEDKSDADFEKLGGYTFRNVAQPITLYARKKPGLRSPKPRQTAERPQKTAPSENYWRAVQLLAGYLVAAWTALQFVDWLLNRYDISPYWTDILLWTFIGIIPSLLLLFANRDRILKRNFKRSEKIFVPLNLLLLFGTLTATFGQTDLGSTVQTITFQDADGSEIQQNFLKDAFKTDLPIFGFTQEEGPDSNRWVGHAIQLLVMNDLRTDKYLQPFLRGFTLDKQYGVIDKIKSTKTSNSQFYLDGTFQRTEAGFKITPSLRNKKNGGLVEQKSFVGEDIFTLVDSVSSYLRPRLGLSEAQINESVDLDVSESVVNNFSALKHLTWAMLKDPTNSLGPYGNFEKALDLDSTSAYAALRYSTNLIYYADGNLMVQSVQKKAMEYRHKLPQSLQMEVLINEHLANGEHKKAEKLMLLRLEMEPENEAYIDQLERIYLITGEYEKLTELKEREYTTNPSFENRIEIATALWRAGKAKRVKKEALALLKIAPENNSALQLLLGAHLQLEEFREAQETLEKWILLQPESEALLAKWEEVINYLRDNPDNEEILESLEGSYRATYKELVFTQKRTGNTMFTKVVSQYGLILHLANDSVLFTADHKSGMTLKQLANNSDFFEYVEYSPSTTSRSVYYVRQDSTIWTAEAQLRDLRYDEALASYEAAIAKHPGHYYLHEAKQHIEYVQSRTPEEIDQLYQSYAGLYTTNGEVELEFWVEDGQLLFKNPYGQIMLFRPTTDTTFIDLSTYICKVTFDVVNQSVKGYDVHLYDHERQTWPDTAAYYITRTSAQN